MKTYKVIEDGIEYTIEEHSRMNGNKYWYLNGKYHRINGPAIEYSNGTKYWCLNGKYHRINGPACEWSDGSKYWYLDGKYHRINGAAIEWTDGSKYWFLDGIEYTKKEYYLELLKRGLITKKDAFIELI